MFLTTQELIKSLRSSVNVQDPSTEVIDSAYLSMTDEDLTLFIKLGASTVCPNIESLDELESGYVHPIILLAQVELYKKLAVMKANLIDVTADNNNQLKQSQRFNHYMSLANKSRDEYNVWLSSGGVNTVGGVYSTNTLLTGRHYSKYNYEQSGTPKVLLKIDTVTNDTVEFSWGVSNISVFGRYRVYISTSPIVDMYLEGNSAESKVREGATLIKTTYDIRDTYHRLSGLQPSTNYYLAVFSEERNSVFGYSEKSFDTLAPFIEGETTTVNQL